MLKRVLLLALVFPLLTSLAGCAGIIDRFQGIDPPEKITPDDWAHIQKNLEDAQGVDKKNMVLAQGYARVLQTCISTANWYERREKYGEASKLTIGAIGAISAGIIGPSLAAAGAAKSAIAAWGAVGGVTSGVLTSFDNSSISPRSDSTSRKSIIYAVANSDGRNYLIKEESQAAEKLTLLTRLHFNCRQPSNELAQKDLDRFKEKVDAVISGDGQLRDPAAAAAALFSDPNMPAHAAEPSPAKPKLQTQ